MCFSSDTTEEEEGGSTHLTTRMPSSFPSSKCKPCLSLTILCFPFFHSFFSYIIINVNKSKIAHCAKSTLRGSQPLCLLLLSVLLWHLELLVELVLCCLLKITLSPSSHFVPSGIWASGFLAMHFIFHEYLTRTLQAPEHYRSYYLKIYASVRLYIIYKHTCENTHAKHPCCQNESYQ